LYLSLEVYKSSRWELQKTAFKQKKIKINTLTMCFSQCLPLGQIIKLCH